MRRGRCSAIRAYVAGIGGESAVDVETFARRALDSIDPNDPMLPVWFHLPVAALTMIDRGDLSTEVLDRTLTPARQAGAPAQVSVMLFQRGINAYRAGDLDDAESDARAALDVCVEHRLRYILPAPLSVVVDVLRERDALDGAEALLAEHGYTTSDRQGVFDLLLIASRARLRGAQGRWEDAAEELALGWQRSVTAGCGSPGFVAWEAGLAEALVMCGRLREAADHARHAIDEAVAIGIARPHGEAFRALALADPDSDERDAARRSRAVQGARGPAGGGADGGRRRRTEPPRSSRADGRRAHAEDCGSPSGVVPRGWPASCARSQVAGRAGQRPPGGGRGALTASERRVAALAGAGPDEQGDRPGALRDGQDGRDAHGPHVPEARDLVTRRVAPGAVRTGVTATRASRRPVEAPARCRSATGGCRPDLVIVFTRFPQAKVSVLAESGLWKSRGSGVRRPRACGGRA